MLLLNPDAVIEAPSIRVLHSRLQQDPTLAAVAPAQREPTDGTQARVGWPFPTPSGAWVEAAGLGRLRHRVDFLIGSVLLVSDRALTDVGGFDDRFFLYAEESDWQRRAAALPSPRHLCGFDRRCRLTRRSPTAQLERTVCRLPASPR